MTEYAVVYEPANDGSWSAYALDLPVVSCADTREEIEAQMQEALEFHLEETRREGGQLPEPRCDVGKHRVAAAVSG